MKTILQVLSVSDKVTIQDNLFKKHVIRYLKLGDKNPASENRYYVSLTGKDAENEWQSGDEILLEMNLLAIKTQGQWHMSHHSDEIKFIEVTNNND